MAKGFGIWHLACSICLVDLPCAKYDFDEGVKGIQYIIIMKLKLLEFWEYLRFWDVCPVGRHVFFLNIIWYKYNYQNYHFNH